MRGASERVFLLLRTRPLCSKRWSSPKQPVVVAGESKLPDPTSAKLAGPEEKGQNTKRGCLLHRILRHDEKDIKQGYHES